MEAERRGRKKKKRGSWKLSPLDKLAEEITYLFLTNS